MNNKEFMLAGDGWVKVTPCGEFPHVGAGDAPAYGRCTRAFLGYKKSKCALPACASLLGGGYDR